jgi:hypothetical protein
MPEWRSLTLAYGVALDYWKYATADGDIDWPTGGSNCAASCKRLTVSDPAAGRSLIYDGHGAYARKSA